MQPNRRAAAAAAAAADFMKFQIFSSCGGVDGSQSRVI
jgi:hypothetical protein